MNQATALSIKPYRYYLLSGCRVHHLGNEQYRAECRACPGSVWSPPGGRQWEAESWADYHQRRAHAGEPRVGNGRARQAVPA